jgi:hypothetical protein
MFVIVVFVGNRRARRYGDRKCSNDKWRGKSSAPAALFQGRNCGSAQRSCSRIGDEGINFECCHSLHEA